MKIRVKGSWEALLAGVLILIMFSLLTRHNVIDSGLSIFFCILSGIAFGLFLVPFGVIFLISYGVKYPEKPIKPLFENITIVILGIVCLISITIILINARMAFIDSSLRQAFTSRVEKGGNGHLMVISPDGGKDDGPVYDEDFNGDLKVIIDERDRLATQNDLVFIGAWRTTQGGIFPGVYLPGWCLHK